MSIATPAATPPTKHDSRYFAEGQSWEADIARRNRNSRAIAWIIASVMTIIALLALAALAMLVPLKSYEPYMVVVDKTTGFVDKTTGFVEVKRPMAEGVVTQDEAVTTFNVVRYVKAREIYSPANPKNPIKVLGMNTVVATTIKSVTFPNNRTALVRFSTEEKSQTNTVVRHWVSLIRFRYTSTPMKNEYRFENPLGFQVTEYRRDQETAPTPGTTGQGKP